MTSGSRRPSPRLDQSATASSAGSPVPWVSDAADGEDERVGGGEVEAAAGVAVVAGGGDDDDAGLPGLLDGPRERLALVAVVVVRADREGDARGRRGRWPAGCGRSSRCASSSRVRLVMPSALAALTLTSRAPGATPATMPARCVPWPKASRLRRSASRASLEKSGPLTTLPAAPRPSTGVIPESIRATSTPAPSAASRSAPIVSRTSSRVVADVGDLARRRAASSSRGGRGRRRRLDSSSSLRVTKGRSTTTARTPRARRTARTERDGTRATTPSIRRTRWVTLPPAAATARAEPSPTTTTGTLRSRAEADAATRRVQRSEAIRPAASTMPRPRPSHRTPNTTRGLATGESYCRAHRCSSEVESVRRCD